MNKPYLLQKLAPVGVAAFSAISVIGIAATSAQAANLTGQLSWSNGSLIVPEGDAQDAFNNGGSFTAIFSPEEVSNALVSTATVDFDIPLDAGTLYKINSGDGASGTFTRNTIPVVDPVDPNLLEAEFILQNDLVFEFFEVGGAMNTTGVIATLEQGATIEGIFDTNDGSIQFALETGIQDEWVAQTSTDGPNRAFSSVFEFGITDAATQGTFEADAVFRESVPEPTTILGLLTIGSLGLGLKRKKQAYKTYN